MQDKAERAQAVRDLLGIGFERVGRWGVQASGLKLSLDKWGDVAPALYAFIVNDKVMYVGKTKRTLANRLYGYVKGSGTQLTNIRVRAKLLAALGDGSEVTILGLRGGAPQRVGRFQISLPAALEDSIIDELKPPWNGGASRQLEPTPIGAILLPDDRAPVQPLAETGAPGVALEEAEGTGPSFTLTIGSAYFHGGFFNVPRRFEHFFAGDGQRIVIENLSTGLSISGRINRTANQNGTPRIMGGPELRTGIHRHLRLGSAVVVKVLGPQRIQILPVAPSALP